MSRAARLFHSKSDQTLYSRITPSSDQFATQQARWNDLADFLKSRLEINVRGGVVPPRNKPMKRIFRRR